MIKTSNVSLCPIFLLVPLVLYTPNLQAQINPNGTRSFIGVEEHQPTMLEAGGGSAPEAPEPPQFETGLRDIPRARNFQGPPAPPDNNPYLQGGGTLESENPPPGSFQQGSGRERGITDAEVEASATPSAPSGVGSRPQRREEHSQTSSGQEQNSNQSPEQRGGEPGGRGEAVAGGSSEGANREVNDGENSTRNDSNQSNQNTNNGNANNSGNGFGMPGFGQNQVPAKPVFEEERQDIESRIAGGIPACSQKVNWVDQICGPQSPVMQQAQAAVDRATASQPTSKSGQATNAAFAVMMEKANEYLIQYKSKCESVKNDCRTQCGAAVQALSYKQDACGRGLYTCNTLPGPHLAQVNSLSSQCANHDSLLADAARDVMALGASSVAAQGAAQKLAGDAGGTDQATAAAEFQTSGTGGLASADSDKFDLYSDELEPGTMNKLQPVARKPESTNYSNKGGASGPSLGGGGGGSAGYGSAGGGSAGYGAVPSGGGGVIQGYSGGSGGRRGQSGYGQRNSGERSYGSAQRLTRAQYAKLSPAEQARYRKGMQLKDFLPGGTKDPRRLQVAAYQKRDGITGPTGPSIWAKVSNRYRIHQGNLLPP